MTRDRLSAVKIQFIKEKVVWILGTCNEYLCLFYGGIGHLHIVTYFPSNQTIILSIILYIFSSQEIINMPEVLPKSVARWLRV